MPSPFKCHVTTLKNRFHVFVITPKLTGPHKSTCSHSGKKSKQFSKFNDWEKVEFPFFFYKVITLESNVILVRAGLFAWSPFVTDSPLRIMGWVSRPASQRECPWSFSCWNMASKSVPPYHRAVITCVGNCSLCSHPLAPAQHIPHHMSDCHMSDQ